MKLLLHTCCAPCLIYPLQSLSAKGFEVTAYYYNPNIYPAQEYEKRKDAVLKYSETEKVRAIFPGYRSEEFFAKVSNDCPRPQRCLLCWQMRLEETARYAKETGFETFSSTLLVSPHQDQEALKNIGKKIEKESGIKFHYEDFRVGYRQAHTEAKARGIYCQKFCGCEVSGRRS
jgi:hypothetical protein